MSKDKPRREQKKPKKPKAPVATKGPLTAPPVPSTARRGT